jgi:hypothetical protein
MEKGSKDETQKPALICGTSPAPFGANALHEFSLKPETSLQKNNSRLAAAICSSENFVFC